MKKIFLLFSLLCSLFLFSQEEKTTETDSVQIEKKSSDFNIIESVPLYKGCDENLSNTDKKKCMSTKISELVSENFDYKLAKKLKLENGKVRISVQFKIDKNGKVTGIKSKGPHSALEKEANRIIALIPQMKPGYQRGRPVVVPFGFPIVFEVNNQELQVGDSKKTSKSYPLYKGCKEDLSFLAAKECTTKKIKNFIKLSFNMELADKLFPLDKSTQFLVEFTINKNGKVEDINAKAHKREIAAEAIKVVKRLPKFKKPGFENGKPIAVSYSLLMTLYF